VGDILTTRKASCLTIHDGTPGHSTR